MVLVPQSRAALIVDQPLRQAWLVAGCCLVVAAVALCGLFRPEAAGAFRVWMESTAYNHCFLVLPVALYLAWTKRSVLQDLAPQPDLRLLALLLPLTLLWLFGALISVLELQQLIVVAMFQVIALALLGWPAYRALLMPFLYLFFLVPTGYFLVPWLQNVTAWFAIAGLKLVGIPVYSDGMFIEVPSGSFVVAEACAGLRFLIASVAFGVFFASIMYRSWTRWIAFVALSTIVPVIANGIRAFGIIAAAEVIGNATAVEADHIIYGWGFFTAVTFLLILIGMRFAQDDETSPAPSSALRTHRAVRPWRVVLAGLLGLVVAASGPAYAALRDMRGAIAGLAHATAPATAAPWSEVGSAATGWRPVIVSPDREFLNGFSDGTHTVIRYVALYQTTGFHNNLVRGMNDIADGKRWQLAQTGRARARIDGRDEAIATTELTSGTHRLLVWSFYLVNGRVAGSPLMAKLRQLPGLLGQNRDSGAFVALAIDEFGVQDPGAVLQSFLGATEPFDAYLQRLSSNRTAGQ